MIVFERPEHRIIQRVLAMLRSDLLLATECWFAGGTAIVMSHGEYRLSLDVDFLCSSQEGYRKLRQVILAEGARGIFDGPVRERREFRCDQYGLRSSLELEGQTVKFEIVREGRIALSGAFDGRLRCPVLDRTDQIAEKLLANCDRGHDTSTNFRDIIDLGMLASDGGGLPRDAFVKASGAYHDVMEKASRIARHLSENPETLRAAARVLRMEPSLALEAVGAVREGIQRISDGHEDGHGSAVSSGRSSTGHSAVAPKRPVIPNA